MRGTWKKSPSRRGAFASASSSGSDGRISSARVGQSNGTACVIGSTSLVSSARRASTYSRMAPRSPVIARDLVVGQPQAREQRQLANFVGGDPRHGGGFIPRSRATDTEPPWTRIFAPLGARTNWPQRAYKRYSDGSDMRLSGNRFRALVVCLCSLGLRRDGGGRMPDAQTQHAAYSAELLVRFEVTPDKARDGRRCWDSERPPPVPRPTCWGWSIRSPPPRPIRAACCATPISRTARWSRAAARSISRSWAASASGWARPDAADGDSPVPARLPGRRRRASAAWSAKAAPQLDRRRFPNT